MAITDNSKEVYKYTFCVFTLNDERLKYITNTFTSVEETNFESLGPFDTVDQIIINEENRVDRKIFFYGFTDLGSNTGELELKVFKEFGEVANQLDTPCKIINYINGDFIYKEDYRTEAISPQELFQGKQGNNFDFAVFISSLLESHGYNTRVLCLDPTENKSLDEYEIIVLFYDTDGKLRFISNHENILTGISQPYDSLNELLLDLEHVFSLIIDSEVKFYRYGLLEAGKTNLIPGEWKIFDF